VLKITKPSLFGKSVACPSCQKPFRIEAPAGKSEDVEQEEKPIPQKRSAGADDPLPVWNDDIPLKDDSAPLVRPRALAKDDWIPLQDSEPAERSRNKPDSSSATRTAKSPPPKTEPLPAIKKNVVASRAEADSRSSMKAVGGGERSSAIGSGKFVTQAERDEFEAMLNDTEAEEDEIDFSAVTALLPERSSGSKSKKAALEETEEFGSLLDTAEHPSHSKPKRRGKKGGKNRKSDADADTVEMPVSKSAGSGKNEGTNPDAPMTPRLRRGRRRKKRAAIQPKYIMIGICVIAVIGAVYGLNTWSSSAPPKRQPAPVTPTTAPNDTVPAPAQPANAAKAGDAAGGPAQKGF